ncbi:MAG: LamG domain-containing protein, partial [Planctomycetes bacterium]|nr:LamG domain-containing protein [Planctomycetota bacterium]
MLRRSNLVVLCALLLGPAWAARAGMDPNLAIYWPFDEGQGTVANDGSGKGNNGTLVNSPTWVTGKIGGALRFNGSNTYVRGSYVPLNDRSFTVALWVNPVLTISGTCFSEVQVTAKNTSLHIRLGGPSSTNDRVRGIRFGFYGNDLQTSGGLIQDNTWYHIACRYDLVAQTKKVYVNGVEVATGT